jgi:hypothetical protein
MKTYMNTMVLAVVLGLSMSGVAMANFDDEDVRDGALTIRNLANQAVADIVSGEIDVPFVKRRIFAAGFRSIATRAQQVANLSGADDEDEVQDEMLKLAGEIRQIVARLDGQAAGNAELLEVLELWAELSDELIDDLN